MRESTPKFIQGIFPFTGAGLEVSAPLASFTVAPDKRAQPIYFRAGNSSDALVILSVTKDGALMRYFPIGAGASEHVPLAVVEDIMPDSVIAIAVSAPAGVSGTVVVDFGLVEI
ncbi:hypothetical protein BH10PSE13_BH10PSE13_18550 [soil metagenome]